MFKKLMASTKCRARLHCLCRMVRRSLMTVFPQKKVPQACNLPPDDSCQDEGLRHTRPLQTVCCRNEKGT